MAEAVSEIVGREREVAAIASFVAALERGPRALVLDGEAGVGKTTLWLHGVESARQRGCSVLASRPAAAEARLAFAGVGDLLGDVLPEVIGALPAPQADALRVAMLLARPSGAPPDERAVAVALRGAIRELCGSGPVVLAVDDVQWLDLPSLAVLTFAWRRLREEPVGLLLARRAGEPAHWRLLDGQRVERVNLGPLSLGAVHRLLHARLGLVLSRPVLRRVHETAAGNPFFALELGRAVGRRDPPRSPAEPLHLPERLQELVRERLAALPAATREALAAAAALSQPTLPLVTAAGGDPAAIQPARDAGIVDLDGERLRFSHPLLAAAAYEGVDTPARRDLHRRLAALAKDAEERIRHRALATEGPDENVAAALEQAASIARRRGASAAAAELCELARRLTPPAATVDLTRRIVAAARHRFVAGDSAGARMLLEEALALRATGRSRAEALAALGLVHLYEGDQPKAAQVCRKALAQAGADSAVRAEAAMCLATALLFMREDLEQARGFALLAADLAAAAGDASLHVNSIGTKALIECQLGRPDAPMTLRAATARGEAGADARVLAWPAYHRATFLLWTDQADAAADILPGLYQKASTRGDDSAVPVLLAYIALADYLRGRWSDSAHIAGEAYELGLQTGQRPHQALGLSERALVRASLGQAAEARADAAEALSLAGERGMAVATIHAVWALGLLDLSLDRPADAAAVLAPLRKRLLSAGVGEPGAIRFVPDEIEALLALGRVEAAEPLLAWLEERGKTLTRASALAAACRCRGLLDAADGRHEAALARFEAALSVHERLAMPFERARTLLALGATLRRAKQRSASRDVLEQALAGFEQVGAAHWIDRARAEMSRIGGRRPAGAALTPTERRVAELATEGRSNKEIAAALFVTPKTVDTQLSRIYRKLGVHSRTALAHRLRHNAGAPEL